MSDLTPSELQKLCVRLKEDDRSAFTELFRATYPALLRYAERIVRGGDVAADIVQEAFLRLWKNRDRLDPTASVRGLLFYSVRNLALNHL